MHKHKHTFAGCLMKALRIIEQDKKIPHPFGLTIDVYTFT
jgi:hypothetical protein